MNDDIKSPPPGPPGSVPPLGAPEEIVLTITHDPVSGRIDLTGPINNRMLCYGLLEVAKEVLLRRALAEQEKKVVVPRGFRGFRGFRS